MSSLNTLNTLYIGAAESQPSVSSIRMVCGPYKTVNIRHSAMPATEHSAEQTAQDACHFFSRGQDNLIILDDTSCDDQTFMSVLAAMQKVCRKYQTAVLLASMFID